MKRPLLAITFLLLFVAGVSSTTSANGNKAERAAAKGTVTFTKDIAPIFFKNCAQCHRPGEIAPFSALTYKDVRPWAKSIREKVINRQMPPWNADPHYGDFENNPLLTQAEIDTIAAWVDGGAKQGNARDLPPAPKFSSEWEIGKPDVVLTMPNEYELPATGADDYIYFRVPTNFTEDKWVQMSEFRPGNLKVVHHAVVFIETPMMYRMARDTARKTGKDVMNPLSVFQLDRSPNMVQEGTVNRTKPDARVVNDACGANRNSRGAGGTGATLLSAWAPGRNADVYPAGMAKLIPAGSNLIFQMHYSKTTGKPEKDRTSMGLNFAKQPVQKKVQTLLVVNDLFAIPPGAENHEANACMTLNADSQIVNYMPHMHVRGKKMKYELEQPDGKRETLIAVDYDFNWQMLYKLKNPIAAPKGSRLIVSAVFDNSAKNKRNPDPTKTVRFGEPTYDEMLVGFIDVARDKPADRPVARVDVKTLDAYVGEYSAGMGPKFTVTREGDTLWLSGLPNAPALPFTAETEAKFYLKDFDGATVVFVKNGQGQVSEMLAELGGQKIKVKKVAPAGTGAGSSNR
ncbi:MAG: thiol-disulfide isomerase [Blastocatellia bacterium]